MTLEEIFKDNPHLLETKEVKQLLEHADSVVKRNAEIAKRVQDENFQILNAYMYSSRVLISGYSDNILVDKIAEILNK